MARQSQGYINKCERAFLEQNAKERHASGHRIRIINVFGVDVPCWVVTDLPDRAWVTVGFFIRFGEYVQVAVSRARIQESEDYPDVTKG